MAAKVKHLHIHTILMRCTMCRRKTTAQEAADRAERLNRKLECSFCFHELKAITDQKEWDIPIPAEM